MRILALLLLCGAARAQTVPPPGGDGVLRLPARLLQDARQEVEPEGLLTLALSAGAFYVVRPNDQDVKSDVLSSQPLGHNAGNITWLGDGLVLFPAAGALWTGGWLGKSPEAEDCGSMLFEALALSGLEAQALKYAAPRERPDGSDHHSFPSGHATSAFAVAGVLGSDFGWKAGVPAYLAAALVGYSRPELNKHFLSDVVFGAGLGIASGRAVFKAHSKRARGKIAWAPYFGPGAAGLAVAF